MQPKRTRQPRVARMPRPAADTVFTYKDITLLEKYITPQGYIVGRDRSGLSQKQQRRLTQGIKRARQLALLPFTQTL